MTGPTPMERYAERVRRDAEIARRRSLVRRSGGALLRKYVEIVPSVFTATGEFAAFRLLVPAREALDRLRERAILTLDSATEVLAGFRFGRNRNIQAYFDAPDDLPAIEREGIGERLPGTRCPLGWSPPGWEILFAVVPEETPPHEEVRGFRVVSVDHLIRDLIGFYGLRTDLAARIDAALANGGSRTGPPCGRSR
ncbi:MAG: hypothetical protein JXP34_19445 [Planctomycetes bacterium]|nr:hypothetical protein [Planctomycetota bacterium]